MNVQYKSFWIRENLVGDLDFYADDRHGKKGKSKFVREAIERLHKEVMQEPKMPKPERIIKIQAMYSLNESTVNFLEFIAEKKRISVNAALVQALENEIQYERMKGFE